MNDENIKKEEIQDNEENNNQPKKEEKTYDTMGMWIGTGFGVLIAIIGITDILMGIIVGMFLGLVIGSFIKR